MVFWTLGVTRSQSVKMFFLEKFVFQISPPSLWRISMLVTRIAISKYYKTRNGFLDSRGHQDTVCEDFFLKKCIFQISHPSLWQISIVATRIAISKYYKTRNDFLDSRGHQDTVCEDFFFLEKMHFSNFTSVAMANFYSCDPHCHF